MTERSTIDQAISDGKARIADVDSATRERLQSRYASSMELIEAELRVVLRQLEAMGAGDLITPKGNYTLRGRQWRAQYLQGLFDLIDREYQRNAAQGVQDIAQAQREAVNTGRRNAAEAVGGMGLTGGVGPALNTEAYERLIAATDPGSPVRQVMEGYGPGASYVVEQALIDGVIKGQGADPIIRTIRNQIGPGVPRWRIAALVRTETMRAFRGSLQESYKALGVEQVRWTAALGTRTCLACLSRHGDLFPVDYQMDAHVNCRCVLSPYTGLPTDRVSGEEWLRRQPEAVQRAKLGEAYDAFQRGDVSLKDFAGVRRSRTWGDSIYERTPRQVMASMQPGRDALKFTPTDDWQETQRFAREVLGVESVYYSNTKFGNTINEGLTNLYNRGVPMPRSIVTASLGKDGPIAEYRASDESLSINTDSSHWRNPARSQQRLADAGFLGTNDPNHVIYHEVGHATHYGRLTSFQKYATDDNAFVYRGTRYVDAFSEDDVLIAAKVSDYATDRPTEFVAETFAGLVSGKRYPDDVMSLYRKYGGPDV